MHLGLVTYLLNPMFLAAVAVISLVLYFRLGKTGFLVIGCSHAIDLLFSILSITMGQMSSDHSTLQSFFGTMYYVGFLTTFLTVLGFFLLLLQLKVIEHEGAT